MSVTGRISSERTFGLGNRWQQNVTVGNGPSTQLSFNTSNNQLTQSATMRPPSTTATPQAATRNTPGHFTGTEYDHESGTSHAQFRQYNSTQGPLDEPGSYDGSYQPGNPQSLNRYSYVLNNPAAYFDPSVENCINAATGAGNFEQVDMGDDGYAPGQQGRYTLRCL